MSKLNGKIYLFSTGGCGTRTLYKWLKERYTDINGQGNVHHGKPPKKLGSNDKVIYLYGNPIDVVASFYRRHKENGLFITQHSTNLNIKGTTGNKNKFIKEKRDAFKLEEHFDRYTSLDNILIINHDKIWEGDNIKKILEYLNLLEHESKFPAKRERKSKGLFSDNEKEILNEVFSDLIQKGQKIDILIK